MPAVPDGQDAVMVSGCGSTMMSTMVFATAPLLSVTEMMTGYTPFAGNVKVNDENV